MAVEPGVDRERAERERRAYDEGDIEEVNAAWHDRFPHVFEAPNTRRVERLFDERTRAAVAGRRVIDIGCGFGRSSERLLGFGAAYVRGIDISETAIARARERTVPGRLEFSVDDVTQALDGVYDAVFGRSILHHLDYRGFLERVYADNLAPGGAMLFMEPQGANLLIRTYARLIADAHTPDEQSLMPDDLDWFRRSFADVELVPVNYLSFPVALASSKLLPSADNALLRWCDQADWSLARRPKLRPRFRQTMLVVRKPAA